MSAAVKLAVVHAASNWPVAVRPSGPLSGFEWYYQLLVCGSGIAGLLSGIYVSSGSRQMPAYLAQLWTQ
jgi:hypothetical protein